MKKREIGKSGLFVSELGLGCMSLRGDLGEAQKIIDAALHAGINFFDTANLYNAGLNEEWVGQALKDKRKDIILATKVGNKLNPDGNGWTWDSSESHIVSAVKQSLFRLGTDYIDLYQLHGGTMEDQVDETIEAFESLKKEGLILQYGISSIRPPVIKRFLEKSSAISVMMQYSLLDRRPEEWFPMIQHEAASVLTRGTLAKGYLTAEAMKRVQSSNGFANYEADELKRTVHVLTEETDCLHAAAIQFVLREETVASALIGASSVNQLLDSIVAYEEKIPNEVVDSLQGIVPIHQY